MITVDGFIRPSFEEILAEVQANFVSKFDDGGNNNPSVEPEAWGGAMTALIAEAKNDLYQVAEDTYFSLFIGTATGVSLDRVSFPTLRIPALSSIAPVTVTGIATTIIAAGFLFERDDGISYEVVNDITIGGGGSGSGEVSAVIPGTNGNAPVGAIKFIPVPQTGLDTVTNTAPAVDGAPIETNSSLRAQAKLDRSTDQTSSLQAISSRVRQVENVVTVLGFENTSTSPVSGRPDVSFEIVVRGGSDIDVATAIFEAKPAAVETFGAITVPITDPTNGQVFDISFSRVADVSIDLVVTVETNANYDSVVAEPLIRQAVLDYVGGVNPGGDQSTGTIIGEDVFAWKAEASLFNPNGNFTIQGIETVTVTLDKTPNGPPYLLDKVVIADVEQAFTDFAQIAIVEI